MEDENMPPEALAEVHMLRDKVDRLMERVTWRAECEWREMTEKHEALAQVSKLRAENAKMREMLRKLEFSVQCDGENGCSDESGHCPECVGYWNHWDGCELDKLLNGGE